MSLIRPFTHLPIAGRYLAITFDACETITPSYFDRRILNFLIFNQIPSTMFISGKFAIRNKFVLAEISKYPFIEIENHSFNHPLHMERLSRDRIIYEVKETEKVIYDITGIKTKFFRFPGGNYNQRALAIVSSLGYRIIQWSFPSGDPDPRATAIKLYQWVTYKVRPGDILIFHINGRGWHTGEALPNIARFLKQNNYQFIKLEDAIP